MNQKEATFNAIISVLEENGIAYEPTVAVKLTTEQRRTVTEILVEGCMSGTVEMKAESRAKHDTPEKQYKYWNGTVGNWLSKDKRLNGGVDHKIKKPGSRAGQSDPQLRNLKALLVQVEAAGTEEQIAEVQAEIAKRMEAIAAEKAKKVEVNPDLIPEHLRGYVQQ